MGRISVRRSAVRLLPDPKRRITKPYLPESYAPVDLEGRVSKVIRDVMDLSDEEVGRTLQSVRKRFVGRHSQLDDVFRDGFSGVSDAVTRDDGLGEERRLLIGAYFAHEYSIEGAALTNPSMAPHPDQSETPTGYLRVIVTLRAVGEGHRSSIEFRVGHIDSVGRIALDPPGGPVIGARRPGTFNNQLFGEKLGEMGEDERLITETMRHLSPAFLASDLDRVILGLQEREPRSANLDQFVHAAHWVASSNYELVFPEGSDLSQRVLFPAGPTDSHGMEDARLVRFVAPDGEATYYATYTAFDGFNVLPQLISTTDFEIFRMATLNGRAIANKGIAIFPRLIGGQYVALARSDGVNNFLMTSDDVRRWDRSFRFEVPVQPWDLLQVGNAGSPIETEAGWLVITHGVGPMRQYALGAMLLAIDDPHEVVGVLTEPLLEPDEEERDGYVPNVVYSCGAVLHNGHLVIPYGASDTSTRFASLEVDALLSELTRN